LWAMLMPLVIWLGRRYPLERNNWQRLLPIHLLASVLLAILHSVGVICLRYAIPLSLDPSLTFGNIVMSVINFFHINLVTYWAILGVASAFDFYHRWQTEQLQSVLLQEQLSQARLQALQMQLHPHFLFNTLHTIATLVETEPKLARQMIARLGDFLRLTLQDNGAELVTLERELEFARTYLSIEELRFQDRLQVHYSVAPEVLMANVPYLILQPLVENAIRHGIAPSANGCRLELNAERRDDKLRIEVCDDGGKLSQVREGLGLANIRKRLAQFYGAMGQLTLTVSENGNTVAAIEIPFTKTV
jgi:two-component system, LytTR family, sensor kinase